MNSPSNDIADINIAVQNGFLGTTDLFGQGPKTCGYRFCDLPVPEWKRSDAEFCCDAHRVAEHHEKKKDDLNSRRVEIDEGFWTFHRNNPHIYRMLVSMARKLKGAGHKSY